MKISSTCNLLYLKYFNSDMTQNSCVTLQTPDSYYCQLLFLQQLYQIYGRRTPQDVHDILTKYKSSYIILEDSICLAPSKGCRTPDIVDIDNGIVCRLLHSYVTHYKPSVLTTLYINILDIHLYIGFNTLYFQILRCTSKRAATINLHVLKIFI